MQLKPKIQNVNFQNRYWADFIWSFGPNLYFISIFFKTSILDPSEALHIVSFAKIRTRYFFEFCIFLLFPHEIDMKKIVKCFYKNFLWYSFSLQTYRVQSKRTKFDTVLDQPNIEINQQFWPYGEFYQLPGLNLRFLASK